MLPLYLDKLDRERQIVFNKLKTYANKYILAGGTAIMLQIGHRLSYDFDCFSYIPLQKNLLTKARKVFGSSIISEIETSDILSIKTKEGIVVTFVHHPFKTINSIINTSSIPLFHLDDLVANKAYTIGRRGAWRDYVDLFFFLKLRLFSIDIIMKLAKRKFAGEFNEKLFLGQLVYFDDLEIIPTTFIKESYTQNQIKSFLEKEVEDYLKKTLALK